MKTRRAGCEEPTRNLKASTRNEMLEGGKAKMAERSYTRDTGKFWNQAPIGITEAPTKETAK